MRSNRRLVKWSAIPIGIAAAIALAGCTQQEEQGYLPGGPDVTNHTSQVIGLWTTSWIVLLIVGLLVWGLLLWAMIVYRRRRGQTGLPAQLRYNMPIEILYTIVPFILIIGFFAFTARDQSEIEAGANAQTPADVEVQVFAKQWSWDFNYVSENGASSNVHEPAGVQAQYGPNGTIDGQDVPTLWLPVNKSVKIDLQSRDVDHSFWVVDFLYKKDAIPGKTNYIAFTPTKIGEYAGKCAELCGEYHSQMLFKVKVVSQSDYDAHLAALAADPETTGQLGADLNRNQNHPNTGAESVEG